MKESAKRMVKLVFAGVCGVVLAIVVLILLFSYFLHVETYTAPAAVIMSYKENTDCSDSVTFRKTDGSIVEAYDKAARGLSDLYEQARVEITVQKDWSGQESVIAAKVIKNVKPKSLESNQSFYYASC